ncbi:MAG: tetratricopeptide repeat protein [Thermoanaerobaculia bacterium]
MISNQLQLVFLTFLTITAALLAAPPKPAFALPSGALAQVGSTPSSSDPEILSPAAEPAAAAAVTAAAAPPALAADELERLAAAAYEFARAKLLADSGEFETALEGFQRSLELADSDPYSLIEISEFHAYLAQISRSQRQKLVNLEAAAEYAAQAREIAGDNLDVLRSYAQIHLRLVEQQQMESVHEARDAFEILRQRTEGDLQVLLSLAQIYLRQGDGAKAIEVLREAESYRPNHPPIERMLAQALLATGAAGKAEELLARLVERQPGDIDKRLQLAELVSGRGDHRGAVAVLEDGLPSHFANPRLRQMLARELHLNGDNQEALLVADTLLEEFPGRQSLRRLRVAILSALARFEDAIDVLAPMVGAREDEESLQDQLYLCRLLERTGRADEAAAKLRILAAGSSGKRSLQVKVALVGLLDRQNRGDEVIAILAAEFERATEDRVVGLGRMLSQFLLRYERFDEAAAVLDEILARSPAADIGERVELQKIAILARRQDWDRVLQATSELMASDSREVKSAAVLLRADALAELGRSGEALAALERGEQDLPALPLLAKRVELLFADDRRAEAEAMLAELTASGQSDDLLFAARVHQRGGRYRQAIPLLDRLLEQDPAALEAQFFLGAAYERTGERQQAIATFERLIESSPNNAGALNYLGYMWAERGENLEQALSLIQRAIAIEPDSGAFVDSLGWVYFQLGRYDQARQHLEWAARLVPDDPTILEHLGDLYVVLQDLERARNSYRQALDLGTGDSIDELRRKLRTLEQKGL